MMQNNCPAVHVHLQRPRRGSLYKERQNLFSPPIAFLGDSIIAHFLKEGKPTWDKYYGELNTVNFGTVGDSTQMLIEKLEKDELPLQDTKSIVIMIGSTDLRHKLKEQVVCEQIKKIVNLLQIGKIGVKILILGILPRGDTNMDCNLPIHQVNGMLSHIENGFTVRWLNLEEKFYDKTLGKIRQEYFDSDGIFLSPNGYELLAETMAPLFQEIQQQD